MTHICISKLTSTSSDNGFSPGRCQVIIWTNVGILLTGPLETNFSEILIKIHTYSFKKMQLKISSGKWWSFCLSPNVLMRYGNRDWTRGHHVVKSSKALIYQGKCFECYNHYEIWQASQQVCHWDIFQIHSNMSQKSLKKMLFWETTLLMWTTKRLLQSLH